MHLIIDLTDLQQAASNPFLFVWVIFRSGGWIFVLFFGLIGIGTSLFQTWVSSRQRKYLSKITYILLALDIPRGNEQTPKAVESIFAHLHGIQGKGNLIDRYWKGKVQAQLSLEIIGIEGQSQFLIRTPVDFRDVVEAAFFAQYPDAEITEVTDYTEFVPHDFVAAGFDVWGTELIPVKSQVYPIKTYPFFEHSLSQQFLDPLASLLELMGRLGPTEQVWLQIVMTPAGTEWQDGAEGEVKKRLGISKEAAKRLLGIGQLAGYVTGTAYSAFETALASLVKPGTYENKKKEEKKEGKKFSDLTPGEKSVIEAIQIKISKLGWETKFRFVYLAQKEYFGPSRGVTGIMGALKQYSTQDLNGFKPDPFTKTSVDYWFVKRRVAARKRRVMHNYRERELHKKFQMKNPLTRKASLPFVMNIEELASLFHFPVMTVKAPQVQKTEAKRGEPPMSLPVTTDTYVEPLGPAPRIKGAPPSNLPT